MSLHCQEATPFLVDTTLGEGKVDRITEFKPREDHVRLIDAIFRKVGQADVLKKCAFWTLDKSQDRNDRTMYNRKSGALSYDADGIGNGAAVRLAELSKKLALKHTDFLIA